ncbi:hypothetical protein Tco_0081171, partial [Tanacetum coccineum]
LVPQRQETSVANDTSGLVPQRQETSVANDTSGLVPQRQETSVANNTSGLVPQRQKTFVANDTSGLVPQRQKASDYDNSDPALELQNVSPLADTTVPAQQELDLLFGPLHDEFFNDGTSRVDKSSSPTDNSIQKDTLPSMHIQPPSEPSTPTNVHAEENNDNQVEFTNPFCTPSVQIRRQLAIDLEMCMFALTVSTAEPKNIREAMADSAWIESMQEELHQFDRLQVWELVDKLLART